MDNTIEFKLPIYYVESKKNMNWMNSIWFIDDLELI